DLLRSKEFSDVIIDVGEDGDHKKFYVHSLVLKTRSTYFRTALSDDWVKKQGNMIIYNKPNVTPKLFEIILDDDLKLDDLDIPEIIRLLLVSDELFLNELMNFIVDYMLSKRIESLKQYVNNIFEIENGHLAFKRLKKFYTNIIDWEPEVVKPFQAVLTTELFDKILEYHLVEASREFSTLVKPIRKSVESLMINRKHVELISCWIDKKENLSEYNTSNFPYKLKLLLNGNDKFSAEKFHRLCDGKGPTITLLRLKATNEIIGGYNPFEWKSPSAHMYEYTKDSFLFCINEENIQNSIVSRVQYGKYAIGQNKKLGPIFGKEGDDLALDSIYDDGPVMCKCIQSCYEKPIRKYKYDDEVAEYEIFQVIKRFN
ncbi:5762_t:CDS:2, partial [Entrophospora sp. SA101]